MNKKRIRARTNCPPAVLLAVACALAACQTPTLTTTPAAESEDSRVAASPANIASLTDVVTRNPNDPQAFNMRGSVYGQGGRYQEALNDFNKAISLDSNYAQAYSNRGLIYRQTNRLDLAFADYSR